VFTDDGKRRQLEALLHPAIRARREELAAQAGGPYQIHVIPLLVESDTRGSHAGGSHAGSSRGGGQFDRVLVVDCPEALQLARLLARDGCDEHQARAMLGAQASREARLSAADDVIVNDGVAADLAPKVAALHQKYQALRGAARGADR
jgi:dephospho-CoA kinase